MKFVIIQKKTLAQLVAKGQQSLGTQDDQLSGRTVGTVISTSTGKRSRGGPHSRSELTERSVEVTFTLKEGGDSSIQVRCRICLWRDGTDI